MGGLTVLQPFWYRFVVRKQFLVAITLSAVALLLGCSPAESEERSSDAQSSALESERNEDTGAASESAAAADSESDPESDPDEAVLRARRRATSEGVALLSWGKFPGSRHVPIDFAIGELVSPAAFELESDEGTALRTAREFLEQLSNRVLAADIVEDGARRRLERALEPVLSGEVPLEARWRYGAPRAEASDELRVPVRYGVEISGELTLRIAADGMVVGGFEFEPHAVGEPRAPRRFEPGPGAAPSGL